MDSSDRKPLSSASSKRPRLLNAGAPSADEKGPVTSMLASLPRPGRAEASRSPASRSAKRNAVVAGCAILLAIGVGAFFGGRQFHDPPRAAPISVSSGAPVEKASSGPPGGIGVGVNASILASPARIESPPVGFVPTVADALQPPASHSLEASAGGLSHDISSGTRAAPVLGPHPRNALPPQSLLPKARTAAAASAGSGTAPARLAARAVPSRRSDDDADTELVAALIARLDRRGPKPAPAPTTSDPGDDRLTVAGRVRACESKTDRLNARRCRDAVGEAHWGP